MHKKWAFFLDRFRVADGDGRVLFPEDRSVR